MRHLIFRRGLVVSLLAVSMALVGLASVLPVFAVTEVDVPPCRWPHTSGSLTGISYKWGSNLQTSGTVWRDAFEAALSDWSGAPTKLYYYYSSSGAVTINTYYMDDGLGGYSQPYCSGSTTTGYDVYGNSYYSYPTSHYYQAYAGHESGHGQSIGHISDPDPALMGNNPNPDVYYTSQTPDWSLVNQVYP